MRAEGMLLILRVFWEILRYEVIVSIFGFHGIHRGLRHMHKQTSREEILPAVCRAVDMACALYWKRILCLQRSVITARVMHAYGIAADVVIGYRFAPFFSHAWVEVNGHVVNDHTGLPAKLQVLERVSAG